MITCKKTNVRDILVVYVTAPLWALVHSGFNFRVLQYV